MQLLEYHAKDLLKNSSITVPNGIVLHPNQTYQPEVFPVILKSQVPIGGRGKLGGVKLVANRFEFTQTLAQVFKLPIKGYLPESVLVESVIDIEHEYYLALRIDRDERRVDYLASKNGGIQIETNNEPVKQIPLHDPMRFALVANELQVHTDLVTPLMTSLEEAFISNDCLLLEINPLVLTKQGRLVAADAKLLIDDNAQFRHDNLPWKESSGLKPLGGTIGVIANGAGMAMSTMDTIYAAGGKPANFLDIGGGTGEQVFLKYLESITDLPNVTSIIINIFAGITRCDEIAKGIIAAKQRVNNLPPLYIRLEGTNRAEAAALLSAAGIPMEHSLRSCVEKAMRSI